MVVGASWVYGPAAGAVITAALAGRGALRGLGARLIRWRVSWWWYPIGLLEPVAYWGVIYAMAIPLGWSDYLRQPPLTSGIAAAVPVLLLLCLTDGLGEETGWRGFLLRRQLEQFNRLATSCLLGVIWAIWRLPLFWTEGPPLAGSSFLVMIADVPAVSVIFTWILEHTKQSALMAVLLHAAMNWSAFSAASGLAETWQATTLLLISKWLIVAAILLTWARRDRRPPHMRPGTISKFPASTQLSSSPVSVPEGR
jgi:membrane protease YdiL (CAAX protease family)